MKRISFPLKITANICVLILVGMLRQDIFQLMAVGAMTSLVMMMNGSGGDHSSEWSDSWIEKWFNRKVVHDEGQEATSQPTGTGVMEQGDAGSSKIAPQGPQPQPSDPLAIRERESCESIKARICELPRIREELDKAEHYSPGITEKLKPSRAIDLIMDDIIPSEQAKRGIQEGATLKEIRCYKHWLNRVEYGTDPKFFTPGPQSKINDIDIQDKIEPFYRKHSLAGGGADIPK